MPQTPVPQQPDAAAIQQQQAAQSPPGFAGGACSLVSMSMAEPWWSRQRRRETLVVLQRVHLAATPRARAGFDQNPGVEAYVLPADVVAGLGERGTRWLVPG